MRETLEFEVQFCDHKRDRKKRLKCLKLICKDHLVKVYPECISNM